MLQAVDLWYGYTAEPVLRAVNLSVQPGALVGILGPNGSGKTTLLRLLAGVLRPTRGRVMLGGVSVGAIPRTLVARRMAVVPQETHLAFDYTALEIALMGRYPHLGRFELEGPDDLAIALGALAATGTEMLSHRSFMTLSGGEKQRVIIASALAQLRSSGAPETSGSETLLLDEPTASLDLGYQLEVAGILRRLNTEHGLAIVVSTHDLNFAAAVCRELVLIRDGQVITAGPTDAVLTPEAVAALYGVEADVHRHERTGHLTVVPTERIGRTT